MPIDLGLGRITTLLARLGNPHKSSNFIHVAGTNGKGSVCAYLTSILLHTTSLRVGKFTSPHLVYRHDSVTLDNRPVEKSLFESAEKEVLRINEQFSIGATEFEILTATALHIFHREKVDLAVMEVGLGGRLDATNVLEPVRLDQHGNYLEKGVVVTGITKIGLDHETILGSTLSEIAREKAGIIKESIINVVDGTNDPEVLKEVAFKAKEMNTLNYIVPGTSHEIQTDLGTIDRSLSPLQGDYQLQNLSVSLQIVQLLFPFLKQNYPSQVNYTLQTLTRGIQSTQWPGRLQLLHLKFSEEKPATPVLLDGAHNGQAAKELSSYLSKNYKGPITFVLAVTQGKDLDPLLGQLITTQDKIIITKFGAVDGMPWISANDPAELKNAVEKYSSNVQVELDIPSVFDHIQQGENVVICGSLYLVGEVLRLHDQNSL